ncbi:PREDICTED: DNA topoisomerase I, mitochondrial isoform X2 [Wasmannia auropunctata]|uniref:DNA topoisomerase I, mitochondrial isoform X2 n=1 Tax=Wasmannia auropunctata TaxID=64793 RepID=UPI0005F01BF4|nr:PREDICTED: DNA topoisomerase I, mitochondrial isoform X2 [Wasmannia auropunctata]
MELEQAVPQVNADLERKTKESGGGVSGNHSDHINGMSNGFDKKREHKSEHRDKDRERSHKSDHKDKDRSRDKERNHKSEHRDKDKDKHRHSSSSVKDKEKHDSSKDKDKDRKSSSSSKDKEHKSSSSSSKDKEKDKDKSRDKEHHHKSSSSSKDKDRHHSSSKDKDSSSKDKDSKSKDKDRHRHSSSLNSSSRDKDKDRSISKDKDGKKHSSEKDKDRHSTSHSSGDKEKHRSSEKDKDKHRESSSRDKHRHDKDKDRHRHDKSKHREEKEKKDKEEVKVKEEPNVKVNHSINEGYHYNMVNLKNEIKEEPMSQELDDDDDSGGERPLYIKEEDDDEPIKEEASMDSTDGNDTRLSDLHNTTLKTEADSEDDDKPLVSPNVKRKIQLDEDDDVPLSTRKKSKKAAASQKTSKKKKRKHGDDDDSEAEEMQKPKKKNTKMNAGGDSPRKKKQEEQQEVWKWWEEEKKSDGTKWYYLEHKGPVFAPPYEPLPPNVKFYYNGKEMKLSEETEEVATFYARMLDHDYTTKAAFNNNFFHDWREVMTESERARITDLAKCNFKEMHAYFVQKSEERKAMTKEEKQKIKEKNEEIQKEYGFCTIDGHKEKIGNFKIEPPGLFRGRGEHPKMGKLKKRVLPEDVLINCSKDSNIPKPPPGHKWKEVRHDSNVTWLASWTENIQGQVKYVMLNPSSKLKGEKDWQKYETARKLAQSIDKIRAEYREDWKSKEMRIRQRAVALYFIDKLALRAGNEKDEDQADTVGCCSLRVEHIKLHEQKDGREYVVVFDFLGKDSIRYYNEVPVEKRVFKNLQLFMENKSPGDDLFDRLNTTVMNKHLNELMEGLTAKVFRTYNASWTLQQQLDKLTDPDETEAEKILSYNRANRAVAILCNHQRSVPKTHAKSMENLKAKIDAKKEAIGECELQVKDAKRDAKHGSVKEKVAYDKKKKQLERLKDQLTKLEVQATDREENKEIALSTSKLNYLDPRISVAWCKKHNVPIEKIYNKTQRDKFRWAIDMAGPDYVF